MSIEQIKVELKSRSYDILIGKNILQKTCDIAKKYNKIFIITDENVAQLHLKKLIEIFTENNIKAEIIISQAGEKAKSFENLENKCNEILQKNLDRKSLLIAFGGGVIGDLCGFMASVLLRGIDFIQIPTTLLAMVDSSVGGKTAINSKFGKNLIGSFYQPKLVLCDVSFLESLPQRQFLSGYAEIIKYGLIKDQSFFKFLEENWQEIFVKNSEYLIKIIKKSCQIKAKIVAEDETEQGVRAILNFGHTIGHALEAKCQYSDLCFHGEAVAIGMFLASKISFNLKMITAEKLQRIKNHLDLVGFNFEQKLKKIKQLSWPNEQNFMQQLYKDKKTENAVLTFILLKDIGHCEINKHVSQKDILKVIEL